MSQLFVCIFLIMNGIFRMQVSLTFAQNTCHSHEQCNSNYVCCRGVLPTRFTCRKRLFESASTIRSCFGYYCSNNADCLGPKDEGGLCCRSNRCGPCAECETNSNCNRSQICCKKAWYEVNYCNYTCAEKTCVNNSNCATNECCSLGRCTVCKYPRCRSHLDCLFGQYCCDNKIEGKCKWRCVGDHCLFDKHCATMEHCYMNKCLKGVKCQTKADCNKGSYCCKLYSYHYGVCARTCTGERCLDDIDCSVSDECCLNHRCLKCGDSCASSSECLSEAYCCKGYGRNKCASKCDQESCVETRNCVKPNSFCVKSTCTTTKQCTNNSQCRTSNGEHYQCCIIHSGLKVCSKHCSRHECISDSDCAPTECCQGSVCVSESKCNWTVPNWLIGVFVAIAVVVAIPVFAWYTRSKIQRSDQQQSDENMTQSVMFLSSAQERVENIYSGPPGEASVTHNTRFQISLPETQEQIYYSLLRARPNDFNEMVQSSTSANDPSHEGGESIPSYPSTSPDDYIQTLDNPTVSPPSNEEQNSPDYDSILSAAE